MYICTINTRSDSKRCIPARAKGMYHTGVATLRKDVAQYIQKYWPVIHELAMTDSMAVKASDL